MRYDPNEYLSANFQLLEFESKDGTETPLAAIKNLRKLCKNLEVIRAALGNKPIQILSGYRSISHNEKSGGKPESQHLYGNAADIVVEGVSPKQIEITILELMQNKEISAGGLAAYDTFTHYDIRGNYVTWKT